MTSLVDSMRDEIKKKGLGAEKKFTPSYPGGIDILDYRLGKYDVEINSVNIGFGAGKLTTFIGNSGGGKTTLAIQTATNIIKDYDEGLIVHFDFEHATDRSRIQGITGMSDDDFEKKYMLMDSDISADSFFNFINVLAENKIKNHDDLIVDLGMKDNKGEEIEYLPPSIVILDSIPAMYKKDINDKDEMSGQMDATSQAKFNNQIIKRLIGSSTLEKANIMIFAINHITTNVNINPYAKTPKALNYLKEGESLVGGSSFTFLASNIIRITPGAKLKDDEKYGIKGFYDKIEILKSRTNESGREFELVFNQSSGFDNTLTNLNILQKLKCLEGNGRAYHIGDLKDETFTLKTFKEKYNSSERLREYFDEYMKQILIQFVPETKYTNKSLIENISEESELDKQQTSEKEK